MGMSFTTSQGVLHNPRGYILTALQGMLRTPSWVQHLLPHKAYLIHRVGRLLAASQGPLHIPSEYITYCLARHTSYPKLVYFSILWFASHPSEYIVHLLPQVVIRYIFCNYTTTGIMPASTISIRSKLQPVNMLLTTKASQRPLFQFTFYQYLYCTIRVLM